MKLRSTQLVGLVAVVFFGGYLGYTLLKPKRDPMVLPSGVDLRKLPSVNLPPPDLTQVVPDMKIEPFTADMLTPDPMPKGKPGSTPQPTPEAAALLSKGSKDAQDDLYCAGVIAAVDHAAAASLSSGLFARQNAILALSQSGVKKLAAEDKTAPLPEIADAQSQKAGVDFDVGKLRISFPDCARRAAALSPPMSTATPAPQPAAPTPPPAPPADPLNFGSQDAKDDLYCAGIIAALGKVKANKVDGTNSIELDGSGVRHLIMENDATLENADIVAKAQATQAEADLAAGKPRLSKEACQARYITIINTPVQR